MTRTRIPSCKTLLLKPGTLLINNNVSDNIIYRYKDPSNKDNNNNKDPLKDITHETVPPGEIVLVLKIEEKSCFHRPSYGDEAKKLIVLYNNKICMINVYGEDLFYWKIYYNNNMS